MTARWIRLSALALLATGVAACGPASGPRRLSTPRLDSTAPFRWSEGAAAGDDAAGPATSVSFEERLRQRAAAANPETLATLSLQTVQVSVELVADLPLEVDGWRWARYADLALGVHAPRDGNADALIVALRAPVGDGGAVAGNRFLLAVDPVLASPWMEVGSPLAPLAVGLSDDLQMPAHEILDGLEMLLTPTLGRGLGYDSDARSFSGWRWIGSNDRGTFLRLGRTRGTWGTQGSIPEAAAQLLSTLPLASAGDVASYWDSPMATASEGPAMQLVGTAHPDRAAGVQVAIVCRLQPDCRVADDLSRWLDTLRPPDDLDQPASGGNDLAILAEGAGLRLYAGDRALTATELQRAVDDLTATLENEGFTSIGDDSTAAGEPPGDGTEQPGDAQQAEDGER